MRNDGFGAPAPGGALALSPEIGYADATEPVQSRPAQHPSATGARRRAQPRPDTRSIAAPATVAPKHNPHKRTPPAAVIRDGLFNLRSAARYGAAERSELGIWATDKSEPDQTAVVR
jgi:hypothetical protein